MVAGYLPFTNKIGRRGSVAYRNKKRVGWN
jgi:hypothetical protein